jgi:hypothetical protein
VLIDEKLASRGSVVEVFKVIKLLLFSAVTGVDKEKFIQIITTLDAPVQLELMTVIAEMREEFSRAKAVAVTPMRGRPRAQSASPWSVAGTPLSIRPCTPDTRLLAENKHLNEQVEELRVQLDETGSLYDDLLVELKIKNPKIDQLQFRVREAEAAASRLKQVEDEVEELRNVAVKHDSLKLRYEEATEKLNGVKAVKTELTVLQKENEDLALSTREARELTETLNVRVADYRVRLKAVEQQLDAADASAVRKDKEIERVSTQRDQLEEQLSVLKTALADLRSEMEEAHAQHSRPTQDPEEQTVLAKEFADLQRRNVELTEQLDSASKTLEHDMAMLRNELADAKGPLLAAQITVETSKRDIRIAELEFQVRQQADDLAAERKRAVQPSTEVNSKRSTNQHQPTTEHQLQQENGNRMQIPIHESQHFEGSPPTTPNCIRACDSKETEWEQNFTDCDMPLPALKSHNSIGAAHPVENHHDNVAISLRANPKAQAHTCTDEQTSRVATTVLRTISSTFSSTVLPYPEQEDKNQTAREMSARRSSGVTKQQGGNPEEKGQRVPCSKPSTIPEDALFMPMTPEINNSFKRFDALSRRRTLGPSHLQNSIDPALEGFLNPSRNLGGF